MKLIKLGTCLINADKIALVNAHTIGQDRYTLLADERCVLDLRTDSNELLWTRQFDNPDELNRLLVPLADELGLVVSITERGVAF